MGILLPNIKIRFLDENANSLAGGKLYTYIAGTTTPLATYSDNEVTPNTNPVVLNANGEADVWLASSSTYKFVLKDSADVTQWEVDNISGTAGGGGSSSSSGWSAQTQHTITNGQAATDLSGETIDFDDYSSAIYDVEIIRGTTVIVNGPLAIQNLNGTGRVILGGLLTLELHGVTFTLSQAGTVAQLRAALDSGAGNGTIKLSRRLFTA
jgi:hypothetical protein